MAPPRHRIRASVVRTRRNQQHITSVDQDPPQRSQRSGVDFPLIVLIVLSLLGLFCMLVVTALIANATTSLILAVLAPLIAGNATRGFALGVVSTLLPATVTYWLVFFKLRQRAHVIRNLLVSTVLWLGSVIPLIALAPPIGRNIDTNHPSVAAQNVAHYLPGAQFGAVVTFWGAALLLGLRFIMTAMRRQRHHR